MKSQAITALIATLSASAGVAATLWLTDDQPDAPRGSANDSGEVIELRNRIDELETQLQQLVIASVDAADAHAAAAEKAEPKVADARPAPATREDRATSWQRSQERREQRIREQLLVAGWTQPEIDELERINESTRLQTIEQQHIMAREVRDKYPELAKMVLSQAQNPLRKALGDERYVSYLEATGRPSAVNINRIVPGSAGANAGLREGDVIRSYAGERVFNRGDLERATYDGDYGESVTIEVERDGAVFHMTVPRGPLGTSLGMWN